jgi:hypothetical protein
MIKQLEPYKIKIRTGRPEYRIDKNTFSLYKMQDFDYDQYEVEINRLRVDKP